MGLIQTRLGINNGNGGDTQWVEALVDTGASHTALPASLLTLLGIQEKRSEIFTLADGREMPFSIGEARIYVEDREAVSPVVFGAEGRYLLGAISLQVLGLIPDTTNERLIPTPKLYI